MSSKSSSTNTSTSTLVLNTILPEHRQRTTWVDPLDRLMEQQGQLDQQQAGAAGAAEQAGPSLPRAADQPDIQYDDPTAPTIFLPTLFLRVHNISGEDKSNNKQGNKSRWSKRHLIRSRWKQFRTSPRSNKQRDDKSTGPTTSTESNKTWTPYRRQKRHKVDGSAGEIVENVLVGEVLESTWELEDSWVGVTLDKGMRFFPEQDRHLVRERRGKARLAKSSVSVVQESRGTWLLMLS